MNLGSKLFNSVGFTLLASALVLAGCSDDKESGATASGTGGGTDTAASTGDTTTTTATGTDTGTDSSGTTTDTGTTDTTDEGTTFLTTDGETTAPPPGPLGAMCTSDMECESGFCYELIPALGLAGFCSECSGDQDCVDAGTGTNCTLGENQYFVCSDGGRGEVCESDAACGDGLSCGNVLSIPLVFDLSTCGDCLTTADCSNGQLCDLSVDLSDITNFNVAGQRECVDPGSEANGSICDFQGDGDQACAGTCEGIDPGLGLGPLVGVCGDCEDGVPCPMGQTCTPGMLDQNDFSVTGSTCG